MEAPDVVFRGTRTTGRSVTDPRSVPAIIKLNKGARKGSFVLDIPVAEECTVFEITARFIRNKIKISDNPTRSLNAPVDLVSASIVSHRHVIKYFSSYSSYKSNFRRPAARIPVIFVVRKCQESEIAGCTGADVKRHRYESEIRGDFSEDRNRRSVFPPARNANDRNRSGKSEERGGKPWVRATKNRHLSEGHEAA